MQCRLEVAVELQQRWHRTTNRRRKSIPRSSSSHREGSVTQRGASCGRYECSVDVEAPVCWPAWPAVELTHVSFTYYAPAIREHFGIARSVRLSVPRRSCLGYMHAGCLQLSHRRPPETCGLRTRPRTDVDPPRFLIGGETIHAAVELPSAGAYRFAAPGAMPCQRRKSTCLGRSCAVSEISQRTLSL